MLLFDSDSTFLNLPDTCWTAWLAALTTHSPPCQQKNQPNLFSSSCLLVDQVQRKNLLCVLIPNSSVRGSSRLGAQYQETTTDMLLTWWERQF
jgi:hypothetical protein